MKTGPHFCAVGGWVFCCFFFRVRGISPFDVPFLFVFVCVRFFPLRVISYGHFILSVCYLLSFVCDFFCSFCLSAQAGYSSHLCIHYYYCYSSFLYSLSLSIFSPVYGSDSISFFLILGYPIFFFFSLFFQGVSTFSEFR